MAERRDPGPEPGRAIGIRVVRPGRQRTSRGGPSCRGASIYWLEVQFFYRLREERFPLHLLSQAPLADGFPCDPRRGFGAGFTLDLDMDRAACEFSQPRVERSPHDRIVQSFADRARGDIQREGGIPSLGHHEAPQQG